MDSMLDKIYRGAYSPFDRPVSQRQAAVSALDRIWRSAEERLGWEAADALRTQYSELLLQDNSDDFRAGFRLGAALMLEVFDAPD